MSDEPTYSYKVQLQRGETDGRDKHTCDVTASDIDELQEKVQEARELMAEEIAETRTIQGSPRQVSEDTKTFDEFQDGEEGEA